MNNVINFSDCLHSQSKIKVTTEIEHLQRAFSKYATYSSNTYWTQYFEREYKDFQFTLHEQASIPEFSGKLDAKIRSTMDNVKFDSVYSKDVTGNIEGFQNQLQEFQRITTVISVGGKSIRDVEENYVAAHLYADKLTKEQLKMNAIDYMRSEYNISAENPNGAIIPNKELAIFESTSHCMLGIVFKMVYYKIRYSYL